MGVSDGIVLEQTVLGHALNDSSCFQLFVSEVQYTYFTAPNHRVLAFCLLKMSKFGIKKPDEDSFQLVVSGYPEEDKDYGGTQYVRQLRAAFLEQTENYEQFVAQLKIQSLKNTIGSQRVNQLVKVVNDPTTSISQIREIVNQVSLEIEECSTAGYNFIDIETLGEDYLEEIENRKTRKFYTTGLTNLDEQLTEGFAPKLITVMAGFTGMAKSTVCVNMAHRVAVAGVGAAIFSMESTSVSIYDKLVSTLTAIPLTKLKKETASLTPEEIESIKSSTLSLNKLPLLVNDQASVSIDGMLYQLQSAKQRGYDPKVIFIDLFGKLEDVDTGENLAQRIQKEMKRMRVLAKTLEVHFVCIVQIGRQGFGKGKLGKIRRPTLIDIKNANAYAEEADNVFLLHRNKYYQPDLDFDVLEVEVAKQRDGETGTVYFELDVNTSTIKNTELLPSDVS